MTYFLKILLTVINPISFSSINRHNPLINTPTSYLEVPWF